MPAPTAFIEHLRAEGYHPRSNKHSNALAEAIVRDLIENCPRIAEHARAGSLVYTLNFDLIEGQSKWNVDLVMGMPPPGVPPPEEQKIRRTDPATVRIAIELKSVMTEHRKAVRNRTRDFEAHHDHVRRYSGSAIAGAVMVINAAPTFQSPLRQVVTAHKDPAGLAEHCVREMRNLTMSREPGGRGLDAAGVLVVNMDNVERADAGYDASYVVGSPAPQVGDPLHYDAFVQLVCSAYARAF